MAVSWNETTIIWGGQSSDANLVNSQVLVHHSGKWHMKETSGDVPNTLEDYGRMAHVVNDHMFVLGYEADYSNENELTYSLNLNTWVWTKLEPNGTPIKLREGASSWLHDDRIFIFGGTEVEVDGEDITSDVWPKHPPEYLPCYNITNNSWECVRQEGDIPSNRYDHSTLVCNNTVYLVGGVDPKKRVYNDLHILDMASMRWTRLHGSLSDDIGPVKSKKVTLVRISQSTAVLLGIKVCWLLNLDKAKRLADNSSIWTKLPNNLNKALHAAVIEPASRSLWIIGGFDLSNDPSSDNDNELLFTSEVHVMPLNPSLKDLAVATVARTQCPHDPSMASDNLASHLRDEVEKYRTEMGGKFACSRRKRCSRVFTCMLALEPPRKKAWSPSMSITDFYVSK